jgi:long-subunit fatty acid transport protein
MSGMSTFTLSSICAVCVCVLWSAPAQANNTELVPLGDQAALLGRAVVASSSDAGSLWYNPAGLSWLSGTSVNLSGSAFVLRMGALPDLYTLKTGAGPRRVDEEYSGLLSIPSAVVFVRELTDDLTGAAGVFVPNAVDIFMRRTDSFEAAGGRTDWGFQALSRVQEQRFGAGLGWRATDGLRVGAAVFGARRDEKTILQAWSFSDQEGQEGRASDVLQYEKLASDYGVAATAGVQYDALPWLRLGLTARSPVHRLFPEQEISNFGVVARDGAAAVGLQDDDKPPAQWSVRETASFRLGTQLHTDQLSLNLEGEYRAPGGGLTDVVNGRVGAGWKPDHGVLLGVGLFVDRSQRDTVSAGDFTADYYGGSVGVRLEKLPAGDRVRFHTTVAVSYAIGSGHLNQVVFDPAAPAPIAIGPGDIQFTSHDLGLYVGSGIEF